MVSDALKEKLSTSSSAAEKPWMKLAEMFPTSPEFREELARIDKIIEDEFERIDDEDWK